MSKKDRGEIYSISYETDMLSKPKEKERLLWGWDGRRTAEKKEGVY